MYSAGRRSSIPGLGRAIRLVMPRFHSGSRSSSSYVIGSGASRESLRSFQNRFEYPAKWWPVIADRTPGLMPTNSTRKPGRMRSFKRSLDQSDFIILFLAVTSTFNAPNVQRLIRRHPNKHASPHPSSTHIHLLRTIIDDSLLWVAS